MKFDDPSQLSLRGSLILADPSLRDPNFARSVLLLTDHRHDEGAHGYILNRPTGQLVGELLSAPEFASLARVPVMVGGPVAREQLTFASFSWSGEPAKLRFATHLNAEDAAQRALAGEEVRAFIGYSGWAGGQLESELKQRSWITRKPEARILQPNQSAALWTELLSSMGPWYRLLAGTPDNPSLN